MIVFFVGGITCQEARMVHEFNAQMGRSTQRQSGSTRTMRVICGGDFVTSGSRYCAGLSHAAKAHVRNSPRAGPSTSPQPPGNVHAAGS